MSQLKLMTLSHDWYWDSRSSDRFG